MEALVTEELLKIAYIKLPNFLPSISSVNPFDKEFLNSFDRVRQYCFEYNLIQTIRAIKNPF